MIEFELPDFPVDRCPNCGGEILWLEIPIENKNEKHNPDEIMITCDRCEESWTLMKNEWKGVTEGHNPKANPFGNCYGCEKSRSLMEEPGQRVVYCEGMDHDRQVKSPGKIPPWCPDIKDKKNQALKDDES